jgi:hypothetical protein
MLVLLLMLVEDPATLIANARAQLAFERRCPDRNTTDVTVCGRRNADRFRVPLKTVAAPDPAVANNVAVERQALLHRTTPIQDLSPFLVGGGLTGVSVSTRTGSGSDSGKTSVSGMRPLAP